MYFAKFKIIEKVNYFLKTILPYVLIGVFLIITFIAFYKINFGINLILHVINLYLSLILSSWPAAILVLGIYTLTKHHDAIDYFIRNRMTEVGPGGVKGVLQVKEATKEEIKDKTILETVKDEEEENKVLGQNINIQIEPGVTRTPPDAIKEYASERFAKTLRIEELVQQRLREKYQDRYKSSVRISNGDRSTVVDGLIYSKKEKIQSAIEIKYVSSKSFDAIKFIVARKLRQLWSIGVKRLILVLVSDSFTQEEALRIYNDNLHQAQIYFYNLNGENLVEIEVTNREKHIF